MSDLRVQMSAGEWLKQVGELERAAFLAGVKAGIEAAVRGVDQQSTWDVRMKLFVADYLVALNAEAIAKEAVDAAE